MELLTVAEVAKELGISREAVYKAIREGRLSSVQVLGKLGISRDEVKNYRPVDVRVRAGKRRAVTRQKRRGKS